MSASLEGVQTAHDFFLPEIAIDDDTHGHAIWGMHDYIERPYDLRHARLSTWLNAGVEPARVAEWAGNSVPVLLRVYAKCLSGTEQSALRKIQEAESGDRAEPEHG
jgi:hypothetical protein